MTIELYRLLESVELLVENHAGDEPMDPDIGELIACWSAWAERSSTTVYNVTGPTPDQADLIKDEYRRQMKGRCSS